MSEQQQQQQQHRNHTDRPKRKASIVALSAIQNTSSTSNKKNRRGGKAKNSTVETSSLLFCDGLITLSNEFFSIQILDYLPKQELVHHASLVSKEWNEASKNPYLWTTLSTNIWRDTFKSTTKKKIFFTRRELFSVLKRTTQFGNIKKFSPPIIIDKYNTKRNDKNDDVINNITKLAKYCPNIEELDLSNEADCYCMVPNNEILIEIPNLFQRLQKFCICLTHVTQESLQYFVKCMGERLVELTIIVSLQSFNCLNDNMLIDIAQYCPNIKVFTYKKGFTQLNNLSEHGAITMLKNCKHLNKLSIVATKRACRRIRKFFYLDNGINIANRSVKVYLNALKDVNGSNVNDDDSSDDDDHDSYNDIAAIMFKATYYLYYDD